jgi:hypothetical protein
MIKPQRKGRFYFLATALFLAVFLFSYSISEARQGCCSRHGGVCGCGCCDGTGLSATCAPYYPECNSVPAPKPIIIPSAPTPTTPITTTTPTVPITPTTPTTSVNSTPSVPSANTLPAVVNTSENNAKNQSNNDGGSIVGGFILLALIGCFVWYFNKKNKNEKKDINN